MLSRETVWTGRDNGAEVVYRVPCGREYPVEYWTPVKIEREHGRCIPCCVVEGKSKATVMTQDEVAWLFALGIDGKRSKSDHLHSVGGVLEHYGTIEAVRLKDGKVVRSYQCWSSGWARCARLPRVDATLPWTTIREVLGWSADLTSVRVLDVQEGENWVDTVLFDFDGRWFLFGQDGRAPFLCELPKNGTSVETVADALLSLMPPIVKMAIAEGLEVKRQGDLYLVPLFFALGPPKVKLMDDELTDVPMRARYKLNAGTRFERRLVRPAILGTNHTAGEVAPTTRGVLVRGSILHARREHPPVRLGKQWYLALKNLAVQSWRVPRRGGRAGGD